MKKKVLVVIAALCLGCLTGTFGGGREAVLAGQTGKSGYKDGSAKKALFRSPWDTMAYKKGWAISDTENHVIRDYHGGKVSTLADTGNNVIRVMDRKGKVKTVVHAYSLNDLKSPTEPCGLAVKGGYLFIGDLFTEELLRIKL